MSVTLSSFFYLYGYISSCLGDRRPSESWDLTFLVPACSDAWRPGLRLDGRNRDPSFRWDDDWTGLETLTAATAESTAAANQR